MAKTVGNDFSQVVPVMPGHEAFFAGLMQVAPGGLPDQAAGEALRRYVRDFLAACDLAQFRKSAGEPYSRIYLGRDGRTGWEAIMMCWERGSATTIHGHPVFAAYNFAAGSFNVELFELDDHAGLLPAGSVGAAAGDGFFAIGKPDTYDNHVHRITCLSDTGHSLHVYRGDARKGVVFPEVG